METRASCIKSSSNSYAAALKIGARPAFPGKGIILRYPPTSQEAWSVQRLKKTRKLDDYDAIVQEQLGGTGRSHVEEAEMPWSEREFYIHHNAIVRESTETTKTRIVYETSARADDSAFFLNHCLEVAPPLQNQLWKLTLRGKFYVVALAGDICKGISWSAHAYRRASPRCTTLPFDGRKGSLTYSHLQVYRSTL